MEEKDFKPVQIALSPVQMVAHSILCFMEDNDDELPQCIELHPIAFKTFSNDLLRNNYSYFEDFANDGHFLGVPIISNEEAEYPRIVACGGIFQYL